jgi:hypothetical protein
MEADILIPIVAMGGAFSIPIAYFFFDSRKNRDRARAVEKAIENGMDPKIVAEALGEQRKPEDEPSTGRRPYVRGLVLLAIGGAFLLSQELGAVPAHEGPPAFVGILLGFLGIAFLIGDLLNRNRNGS